MQNCTYIELICANPWIYIFSVLVRPELHTLLDKVCLVRWITSGSSTLVESSSWINELFQKVHNQ